MEHINTTFVIVLATILAINIPFLNTKLMHKYGRWVGEVMSKHGMLWAYGTSGVLATVYAAMAFIDWRATLTGWLVSTLVLFVPAVRRKFQEAALAISAGVTDGWNFESE